MPIFKGDVTRDVLFLASWPQKAQPNSQRKSLFCTGIRADHRPLKRVLNFEAPNFSRKSPRKRDTASKTLKMAVT